MLRVKVLDSFKNHCESQKAEKKKRQGMSEMELKLLKFKHKIHEVKDGVV